MAGAPEDWQWAVVHDPHSSPQQLADIAAQRGDLHAAIAAHPQAYPALRSWIAQVKPAAVQAPQPAAVEYSAPRRRSGIGWWFAGCGCLAVVALIVLVSALALLSTQGGTATETGGEQTASTDVEAQMRIFEAEQQKYHELAAQLEGNPVAPLVTKQRDFQRIEDRAGAPDINRFEAEKVAQMAREQREDLEQRITAAETRRGNSSGSMTEGLVDSAGNGFIDIGWDAASACSTSNKEGRTTAGCVSEDPIGVHILPESQLLGTWGAQIVVLHELAHLYMRADLDAQPSGADSLSDRLIQQGLFEGSSEKFADCYALTYTDSWSLSRDGGSVGYGYVCNANERQAIRDWAAAIDVPMP